MTDWSRPFVPTSHRVRLQLFFNPQRNPGSSMYIPFRLFIAPPSWTAIRDVNPRPTPLQSNMKLISGYVFQSPRPWCYPAFYFCPHSIGTFDIIFLLPHCPPTTIILLLKIIIPLPKHMMDPNNPFLSSQSAHPPTWHRPFHIFFSVPNPIQVVV